MKSHGFAVDLIGIAVGCWVNVDGVPGLRVGGQKQNQPGFKVKPG